MQKNRQIRDLMDLSTLQYIQDNLSLAMGLAFITVDYKGRQVTRTSGYTDFCSKGQLRADFKERCAQCDAHGGLQAAITGKPNIYYCHASLVDFAVPLIVEGSYIGAVLGGQAKLPPEEADQLEFIMPQRSNWQQDEELARCHDQVLTLPLQKLKAALTLLRDMIQYIVEEEYRKLATEELQERNEELEKERDLRQDQQDSEHLTLRDTVDFASFFSALNVIAKLAYREKAPQTEEAVYDFSAMMRYAMSRDQMVTLGDELEYADRFLRLQKILYGDKLQYYVEVPEAFHGTVCPFMVLRPLVENAVKYASPRKNSGGQVRISARAEGRELLVTVADNGGGMSYHLIAAILDERYHPGDQHDDLSLYKLHRTLKRYYGPAAGLRISSTDDGIEGTQVSFHLPLNGGAIR